MGNVSLQACYREKTGKTYRKKLAKKDKVPGVVYGKAVGSIPVEVDYKPLREILNTDRYSVVDLTIQGAGDGQPKSYKVLIKDLQYDPIKRDLLNVDFHQISLEQPIQVTVPVAVTGKIKDGVLQYGLRELEVSCLPGDIPREITVSVDGLAVGDTITVGDINLPSGVSVLDDPEAVVVTVVAERTAAAEEPGAAEEAGEGEAAGAPGEEAPAEEG